MMSPIKLSLPCITIDKGSFEANDNISFEISTLGLEMIIRDKGLTIQLPLIDSQNVIDALKVFIDSTYEEEQYECERGDEESGKDYFPREKTEKHKLS